MHLNPIACEIKMNNPGVAQGLFGYHGKLDHLNPLKLEFGFLFIHYEHPNISNGFSSFLQKKADLQSL